jgi:hypothetical protein
MSTQLIALPKLSEFDNRLLPILKDICDRTDWEYGEAWLPDSESNLLQLSPVCYISTEKIEDRLALEQFYHCSQGFIIRPGEGLPGRVWNSGESEWLFDAMIDSETYFLRNQIARAFGIRSGLGIPFKIDGKIRAILVLFMKTSRPEDRQVSLIHEHIRDTIS